MQTMTRKQFLQTVAGTAAISKFSAAAGISKPRIKLGVALFSYTGDYGTPALTEDCIADAASLGAEGIELLTEAHIPEYPNPSVAWITSWHGWMDRYGMQPSCYDCRVDTKLRKATGRTPEELLEMTIQDIKLAKRLGFRIVRPAWGVTLPREMSFPVWDELVRKAIPYAEKYDVKVALEIRSQQMVESCMQLVEKSKTRNLGLAVDLVEPGQAGHYPESAIKAPEKLLTYLPYTIHIRGRFHGPCTFSPNINSWERTEGSPRESIAAYGQFIPMLIRSGYNEFISIEYEGPRNPNLASYHLGMQQVRLQRSLGLG